MFAEQHAGWNMDQWSLFTDKFRFILDVMIDVNGFGHSKKNDFLHQVFSKLIRYPSDP